MTPEQFVVKWRDTLFRERQGAQPFFEDLCAVVGHDSPTEYGDPETFTFEMPVSGGRRADAYFAGHFVWEFKSVDRQLDEGMRQAITYAADLRNPPLLIVSSFHTVRIRTNFRDKELVVYEFPIRELGEQENLDLLYKVFFDPDKLEPKRTVHEVTNDTARLFYKIVADMEQRDVDLERLSRYLNQIVFCLYAEDIGLLRNELFTQAVSNLHGRPSDFDGAIRELFDRMAAGGRYAHFIIDTPFNGDLFDGADTVELSKEALGHLLDATRQSWASIEPSIFGTLFERALDASKRSQLGAHYTSAEDIMLVVEPVVMAPLRREWFAVLLEVNDLIDAGSEDAARARLGKFQERLASIKVLDPACGSGNFLYIAMRSLLDLEKQVIDFNDAKGWEEMHVQVKPNQMLGLEINPYAAELARTALWIGYIQWHQANGVHYRRNPILEKMETVRQADAILAHGDTENPQETEWPAAEFIIGNPPFLGSLPLRRELGDDYANAIYSLYGSRIPNASDFCCYWFEKARAQIENGSTRRAGLLATQAIRFQNNRRVLARIKESGDIFTAISDRDWILDGANVHISIVGFDNGDETTRALDGRPVESIYSNLTSNGDITQARPLAENSGICFAGEKKHGPFEIDHATADGILRQPNPHGKPNSDVVKPWLIGRDINQRSSNRWIIDFGVDMPEEEAALYEAPFEYVRFRVKPERDNHRDARLRQNWWLHGRPRTEMRQALNGLLRYIATSQVSKHRLFSYVDSSILPDATLIVFARDGDYFFGVLHSRIHEVWARAMGTQLREVRSGLRYIISTCFETFPFPEPDEEQREAIARAAARLNELREGWLNPVNTDGSPALGGKDLARRTLTNLYNRRPDWLANAHMTLDAACSSAYGWPANLDDAAILERLLALNLERAAAERQDV